ncbi:MAG: DUF1697 domain-containing protein, partial [Solirubrobacteraceae bacterium]
MIRYAAFLRGINLGSRRVTNDRLRACFQGLGLQRPATFRASGNVIFEVDRDPADVAELSSEIEAGLERELGFQVRTFLRDAGEIQAIAAYKPFPEELMGPSEGKLQVMLLERAPSQSASARVLDLASEEDRLAIRGRECYWLPRGRMSDSTLDLKTIASALGEATQRTKATIELIAERHFPVVG